MLRGGDHGPRSNYAMIPDFDARQIIELRTKTPPNSAQAKQSSPGQLLKRWREALAPSTLARVGLATY
ncbi:hypothetical protein BQ8482_110586 [Mesorhizobium delmotii]|uniref:Uncharacterized protein n=1 Tax=Mesorhizobium delmotii TaxID=1631247 RepID=A0A2P9AC03_9HYPH|nr:hypothetical protein BQ8482_110586 [Mesorhizobium delmotii]